MIVPLKHSYYLGVQSLSGSCVLPSSGFFGSVNMNPLQVDFSYQVVVDPSTSAVAVSTEILPELDRGIVEGLLPIFFNCGSQRRLRSRELQAPTRWVIGISKSTTDTVTSGSKYRACALS